KSVALVQADPAVMAELQRLKQENAQLQRDLNTMRALAANSIAVFTNPPPSTPVQGAQSPPAVSSSPSPSPPRPPAIQLDTPDRTRLADNARTITRNTPSPTPPQRPAQPAGYATNYSTGSSTPRRPPPANPTRPARTHVVKEGETFSSLSRQYGITVAALRSANPYASPEKLRPGQALTIPTR
ncbi:MAG: LysM peptidoglycan-binding domain-containing protein, partial [Verrucomicrobia bacterium]|nr:LysM peptidoglycan-binding domain-containing protein [Verrucomicrobiota bacterium]